MPLPAHVWIAPPEPKTVNGQAVQTFPWVANPARWRRSKRLLVRSWSHTNRSMGQAGLDMRSATFREAGSHSDTTDPVEIVAGAYVAITEGGDTSALQPGNVVWWGFIADANQIAVRGLEKCPGQVNALELGHILDICDVDGWAWADADDAYGTAVRTVPPANYATQGGEIIGNAIGIEDGNLGDVEIAVFARNPDDCGTSSSNLWSRALLLEHLISYCMSPDAQTTSVMWPTTELLADVPIILLLADTSRPEAWDLRRLSYRQVIDLCVPISYGLAWDLRVVYNNNFLSWQIAVVSTTTVSPDPDNHPDAKATAEAINANSAESFTALEVAENAVTLYDQVRVTGANILIASTLGQHDSNINQGWSYAQQAAFALGAGPGATQAEHTRRRSQPDVAAVGTRYVIASKSGYDVRTQIEPVTGGAELSTGNEYSGDVIPAIPQVRYGQTPFGGERQAVDITGTAAPLQLSDSISRAPYMPTARIASDIPWPTGVKPRGLTDDRDSESAARPQYLKPPILLYDDTSEEWTDLLADGVSEQPRLALGGTGLAFTVRFRVQEYLLKNWQDGGSSSQDYEGALTLIEDWSQMVVTLAVESDQSVEEVRTRVGSGNAVRNVLQIDRPDLGVWIVRKGAILGLADDGEPLRASTDDAGATTRDIAVRNDWPTVERIADFVATYAFTPRRRARMELKVGPVLPTWARVGTVISTIDDGGVTRTVNTVIRSITTQYDAHAPRRTIQTDIPDMPGGLMVSPGASSTARGGQISLSTGATTQQTAARAQQHIADINAERRDRTILEPRAGNLTTRTLQIGANNTLFAASGLITVKGIKATPVSELPAGTPTSLDQATPDGVGVGNLAWGTGGSELVWVIVSTTDGQSDLNVALPQSAVIESRQSVSLPVSGGGGATASAYLPFTVGGG